MSKKYKIRYSTNWMGVANMKWYIDRGLTEKKTITITEGSLLADGGKYKPGDTIEVDHITVSYSCGRIDVSDGTPYGTELSVPPMYASDWNKFGDWLWNFETDEVWSLKELVLQYEKTYNEKIMWYETPEWDKE